MNTFIDHHKSTTFYNALISKKIKKHSTQIFIYKIAVANNLLNRPKGPTKLENIILSFIFKQNFLFVINLS
jgi:hypothetical protein